MEYHTFFKIFDDEILKNKFSVLTPDFCAISATFAEGSIPTNLYLFLSKFFNKYPSFEAISKIRLFFVKSISLTTSFTKFSACLKKDDE